MNDFSRREKMSSPLNFEWGDELMDTKTKLEVLDHFMESNEGSLADDGTLDLTGVPKSDALDNRKRSLSSNASQLSEGSPAAIVRRRKKPKGMPKRPLSAYNLYFQSERAKIQEAAHGAGERIGFEGLGKIIGKKWRELSADDRDKYEKLAEKDTVRYRKEMEAYNELKAKRFEEEERIAASNPIPEASFDREVQVRSFEEQLYSGNPLQSEPFGVATSGPQSFPISSKEEFSRLHAMTAPAPSQQMGMAPHEQQLLPERAPLDAGPPAMFQVQYQNGSQILSNPQGTHHLSMPPPPEGAERVAPPNSFLMPPGMEIVLSDRSGQDRKYCVQYTCYSMTRDAARKYIDSLTGRSGQERRLSQQSVSQHQSHPQMHVPMVPSSEYGPQIQG